MDDSIRLKWCRDCNQFLPATTQFFNPEKTGKDGLRGNICARRDAIAGRQKYRENDPERVKRWKRADRLRHRDQYNLWHRQYEARHRDRIAQTKRLQRMADIENYRMHARIRAHKRRALIRQSGGTYTKQDIQLQLERQRVRCYYCRHKFKKIRTKDGIKYFYHIEHVVPLSRGGANDMSNIVLACRPCNQRKSGKLLSEWPEGNRLI